MTASEPTDDTASRLREDFDRAFAARPDRGHESVERLLGLTLDGDVYAVRITQVAGIVADRKIVSIPSPTPDLLGIVGIRGALVAVYSLAAVLGYSAPDPAPVEPPRWLLLCGSPRPIGLAFHDFDGYLTVPRADVSADPLGRSARRHADELVSVGAVTRALINITAVLRELESRHGTFVRE